MRGLEECKEMYKDLYRSCLDCGAFDKSRFESTERTAFETFCETLEFVYGAAFDQIKNVWSQEALNEYYK